MSTMSALLIADLIREKAMTLTTGQPAEGYTITDGDEKETVWVILQADFDYEHGALLQIIGPTFNDRPYIMVWWYTTHTFNGDEWDPGVHEDKTDVEWIHNPTGSISWFDAIRMFGTWAELRREGLHV